MITFIYTDDDRKLKIGYDNLRTFVVYDNEGYNNLFSLAIKYKCIMKISDKWGKIVSKTLTISQIKWLSKYTDIVREAERENNNLDA